MSNNIDNVVAVSGLSGLYIMDTSRNNGLILKDMVTGAKQFVSVRKHQFTPLKSIAIYTYSDSTPLEEVFANITAIKDTDPIIEFAKASPKELSSYFRKILPEYDEDRVYTNDMKKVLRWYTFLDKLNYFTPVETTSKSEEE